jgi:hypothetical protein
VLGRPVHLYQNKKTLWVAGSWLFVFYARHDQNYHGAYMQDLLVRYAALLFDRGRILHVCSGALKPNNPWLPGDTLDINPELNPTYCCNAETCNGVPLYLYDTVFVDGPYSEADAAIYGYPMLSRKRVLETLIKGLPVGALIVWLDEIPPAYRKEWPIVWEAVWGIYTSAGHRTRSVFVYRKTGNEDEDVHATESSLTEPTRTAGNGLTESPRTATRNKGIRAAADISASQTITMWNRAGACMESSTSKRSRARSSTLASAQEQSRQSVSHVAFPLAAVISFPVASVRYVICSPSPSRWTTSSQMFLTTSPKNAPGICSPWCGAS